MSKAAGCKRKLKTRTISEKYKILKELDKGESCACIAKKYNIAKQTLSGWLKEKARIYSEVEKNKTSEKRLRMRGSSYEDMDKWLLNARHQNIPISGTILKEKALYFAKELGGVILIFKHRMGGLIDGRNDSMFLLKQCQVFIYFLILIYICLESSLLKISMNSLCPRNTNMHGTLIPIPSPKLTALPSTILTLQSLCPHLRK